MHRCVAGFWAVRPRIPHLAGLRAEQIEERPRSHDSDPRMLLQGKKFPIAGDDESGTSLECGGVVLVVVRVRAHTGAPLLASARSSLTVLCFRCSMSSSACRRAKRRICSRRSTGTSAASTFIVAT